MAQEIEADYVDDYHNEDRHCRLCDSYHDEYCKELERRVSPTGNCDFLKLKD